MTTTGLVRPGQIVLTSWKEIAHYVGKGVRTVQRWEFEFGFPIRRTVSSDGTRGSVLAVLGEIDEWVQNTDISVKRCELERLRDEVVQLRRELQKRDDQSEDSFVN